MLRFVDATSFVAVQELGLRDALSFDRHVKILGFALIGDVP
jgi:predicted nucleic acid-binding protein